MNELALGEKEINGLLSKHGYIWLSTKVTDGERNGGKERNFSAAVHECRTVVLALLAEEKVSWTPEAGYWFDTVVTAGFYKAIVKGSAEWPEGRDKVIEVLRKMVNMSVHLAGPGNRVEAHHASIAYEALRCDKGSEPIIFCE